MNKKVLFLLLVLAGLSATVVALVAVKAHDNTTSNVKHLAGIKGVVVLGPTCPVVDERSESDCADKPYKTRLVVTTSDQSRVIAEFSSNEKGEFITEVPPGDYAIRSAAATGIGPYCASNEVIKVKANSVTETTVNCDSGIR